jgi:hypothetical protein
MIAGFKAGFVLYYSPYNNGAKVPYCITIALVIL